MLGDLWTRSYWFSRTHLERLLRPDEEGQGMVEYALILMLVAIVVITILTVTGRQVNNAFSNVSNGLAN